MHSLLLIIEAVVLVLLLVPTITAMVTGAPWVPTPMARGRRMLEVAKVKAGETVYDLGCGDGRLVQLAAKEFKARGIGIELSPLIYVMARIRNFLTGSHATILFSDFRKINLSCANVIVFYLMPPIVQKMKTKFQQELPEGARIVSYAFRIEGWEPIHVEPKNPERNFAPIYVYEIPKSIKAPGSEAKA